MFRDQEFGADMYSRAVQRIQEVRGLRAAQFPEDAGPMAHPVRPQSYMEISNFYTATVYEKGAEVVRMIHTLIGPQNFRSGMDLYFQRHDGQAVTTDDFVQAMQDASGVDLTQFRRWYEQAGTPVVRGRATLRRRRAALYADARASPARPPRGSPTSCRCTSRSRIGLVEPTARTCPAAGGRSRSRAARARVLSLKRAPSSVSSSSTCPSAPVPSLLRGFSAPVI